jgi:hypothetical protein
MDVASFKEIYAFFVSVDNPGRLEANDPIPVSLDRFREGSPRSIPPVAAPVLRGIEQGMRRGPSGIFGS